MTDATTDVFNQNTDNSQTTTTTSTSTEFTSDLVGEGKKFKTVQDLEKGKVESDTFITQLQGELSQLREDLSQRASVQEAIEQLKNTSQSTEDYTSTAVDADQLAKLVAQEVNRLDGSKSKQANTQEANDKLVEVYGDKAREHLDVKAMELGVSVEFLKSTAEASPKAFFNLLGMTENTQVPTGTTVAGSINPQSLVSSGASGGKDWAYYETMRRENPTVYHSAANAREMFEAQKEGRLD